MDNPNILILGPHKCNCEIHSRLSSYFPDIDLMHVPPDNWNILRKFDVLIGTPRFDILSMLMCMEKLFQKRCFIHLGERIHYPTSEVFRRVFFFHSFDIEKERRLIREEMDNMPDKDFKCSSVLRGEIRRNRFTVRTQENDDLGFMSNTLFWPLNLHEPDHSVYNLMDIVAFLQRVKGHLVIKFHPSYQKAHSSRADHISQLIGFLKSSHVDVSVFRGHVHDAMSWSRMTFITGNERLITDAAVVGATVVPGHYGRFAFKYAGIHVKCDTLAQSLEKAWNLSSEEKEKINHNQIKWIGCMYRRQSFDHLRKAIQSEAALAKW